MSFDKLLRETIREIVREELKVALKEVKDGGRHTLGESRKPTTSAAAHLALIKQYPYLTLTDAAKLVRKSRTTIYEAMYSGELETLTQGKRYYIKREVLDDWMERGAPK